MEPPPAAPGRSDENEPRFGRRSVCDLCEDVSRGVPGGDDGVGMRTHGRQKKIQEGGVGLGRPVDLRARRLAKSGPVYCERGIAGCQTLLQRMHLAPARYRAERRQQQHLRPTPARIGAQADGQPAPIPFQRPRVHARHTAAVRSAHLSGTAKAARRSMSDDNMPSAGSGAPKPPRKRTFIVPK